MVEVCSPHVRMIRDSHIPWYIYGNVYTFHSFLALNSTHIIFQASNFTTIFVLMLIIIVLSFVDWRHG